nr:hypothetical protein CFP56_12891 [Quercus suber]
MATTPNRLDALPLKTTPASLHPDDDPASSHDFGHPHYHSVTLADPLQTTPTELVANDGNAIQALNVRPHGEYIPLSRPLSGPGACRQTRRLQLRNNGFRAAVVPSRKVTPQSLTSASTSWSGTQNAAEDVENVSPAGIFGTLPGRDRQDAGVLREISNPSTLTRPRRHKPRFKMDDGVFNPAMANYSGVYADAPLSSPPLPSSGIKAKSAKTRAKMKRRSISTEHSKHIEFLEAELEAVQSQLRAQISPTVTRQRATHIRSLSTETKQLQEQVDEWEKKFDERLQEMLEPYLEAEADIRARARALEEELELSRYRIGELEGQLDVKTQNMESIETANFDLEQRLEMMARLLASSPSKIDLQTVKPSNVIEGTRRKQLRPKSMLSRFPTVSSLITFPEHHPQVHFSPHMHARSQTTPSPFGDASWRQPRLSIETNLHHSDHSSDAASVFSEAPMTADSMTSEDLSEPATGGFNSWNHYTVHSARPRPGRRMRRFGAGSVGMKSLILPVTSNCENVVSARPHKYVERRGTMPSLESHSRPLSRAGEVDSPCSSVSRRRASTDADRTTSSSFALTPFAPSPHVSDNRSDLYRAPDSQGSGTTTRRYSSYGIVAARNLLDELSAARSSNSSPSMNGDRPFSSAGSRDSQAIDHTTLESYLSNHSSPIRRISLSSSLIRSTPAATTVQSYGRITPVSHCNTSVWTQLRIIFGDLWRSPVDIVRHFIFSTQTHMRIPGPLRNVQWWLIGVLLGPMARRYMVRRNPDQSCISPNRRERQALIGPPEPAGEDMAYGNAYNSPRSTPDREPMSGKGRKRVLVSPGAAVKEGACCAHHASAKHSPWMWLRFSLTLAVAVGVAFKDGPGNLLKAPCILPAPK